MPKPLHKRIETPDSDDNAPEPHSNTAVGRHLDALRKHLGEIERRIDEVEQCLEGDVPDALASQDAGVPTTVAAGRLIESISTAQRSAGQVYALCATLERND
jgi:hypothetical protein